LATGRPVRAYPNDWEGEGAVPGAFVQEGLISWGIDPMGIDPMGIDS